MTSPEDIVKRLREYADDYEAHSDTAKIIYPAIDLIDSLTLQLKAATEKHEMLRKAADAFLGILDTTDGDVQIVVRTEMKAKIFGATMQMLSDLCRPPPPNTEGG